MLDCDFTRLGEELRRVEQAGAFVIHLDIMDGVFVPAMTFGDRICAAANRVTDLPLDVHLMVQKPLNFIQGFADAGADYITVHAESDEPLAAIREINRLGLTAGLSVKPNTPFDAILQFLDEVGLALIMTVEPGKGGQAFMPDMLAKVSAIKNAAHLRGKENLVVSIDGGVNPTNAASAIAAGADWLVAGSCLFKSGDLNGVMTGLQNA